MNHRCWWVDLMKNHPAEMFHESLGFSSKKMLQPIGFRFSWQNWANHAGRILLEHSFLIHLINYQSSRHPHTFGFFSSHVLHPSKSCFYNGSRVYHESLWRDYGRLWTASPVFHSCDHHSCSRTSTPFQVSRHLWPTWDGAIFIPLETTLHPWRHPVFAITSSSPTSSAFLWAWAYACCMTYIYIQIHMMQYSIIQSLTVSMSLYI